MHWRSADEAKRGIVYLVGWKDRSGDWVFYTAYRMLDGHWRSNTGHGIADPDFICTIEPPIIPSPARIVLDDDPVN